MFLPPFRFVPLLVLIFGLATTPLAAADATRPPNIVLIFCDDLGYADLSCQGATDFATPHLDKMAAQGARLTHFYVPASVCSASRAALMTGCYPDRVGVTGVFFPTLAKDGQPAGPGKAGLHPDELTIAEMLKSRGYATTCIGKWHLGDHPDFLPTRQGFDSYFGIPYSNDMGWWEGKPKDFKADFPPIPLMEGDRIVETNPDQRHLTRRYTERAIQFIRENATSPFFLYLPHTMPHIPLFVSEAFSGKARYGLYGDVIQELDWSVGAILATLSELKLDENTLVIFTSDNGPWLSMGSHGGKADPLRDGKFTRYEGGHRVPCLIRWTGRIPAGKVLDGIVSTIDLLPTAAALAGASLPGDRAIDGRDVSAYLTGKAETSPREVFFHSPQVVRRGEWKLFLPGKYQEVAPPPAGNPPGGRVEYTHPRLYHLPTDPGERTSLHAKAEYAGLIEELTQLCRTHQEDLKAASRPAGRVP